MAHLLKNVRTQSTSFCFRVCATLLAVVFMVTSIPSPTLFGGGREAFGETVNSPNLANLVLLVRFAGDTIGDGETGYNAAYAYNPSVGTRWQALMKQYNGDATGYFKQSMHGYFSTVSQGMVNLAALFPQTRDDGGVNYLTLPHDRAYYAQFAPLAKAYNLASDSLAAFHKAYPAFDASVLSHRVAGVVDNVTFLVSLQKLETPADPFWPHMYSLANNGLVVGQGMHQQALSTCNVVDTGNLDTYGVGLVSHEFIHSLGVKDYYRKPGHAGVPVGKWDIMSVATSPLLWPLAQTRQDLGWLSIPEVKTSGTYTLRANGSTAPSSASGGLSASSQSIMFKTPYSNDEYFVAEYRKKGQDLASDLDTRIGGSGLIVYRVNPAYREYGNQGADDYIYLFRAGETSLGAAAGDVDKAQISLPSIPGYVRSGMGSSDPAATVEKQAIVYSDGTNSGVSITALTQDDNSISFQLAFPDPHDDTSWKTLSLADGSTAAGTYVDEIRTTSQGQTLYASYKDWGATTSYQVSSYTDGVWSDLGDPLKGVSINGTPLTADDLDYGRLAVYQGSVYFAASYNSAPFGVVVRRFDAGGSTWKTIATLPASGYVIDFSLTALSGGLYVLSDKVPSQAQVPQTSHPQVFRLNDDASAFVPLGQPLPLTELRAPSICESAGQVSVVCGDAHSSTSLFRFDGNAWQKTLLSNAGSAEFSDVATVGKSAYVVFYSVNQDTGDLGFIRLCEIDGSGTVTKNVSLDWLGGGQLSDNHAGLLVSGSHIYVGAAIQEGFDGGPLKVYSADRSTYGNSSADWTQLGENVASKSASVSFSTAGSTLYAAVVNSLTHKLSFKSYALPPESTVISVTMPTAASFTLDADVRGDAAAQISSLDTIQIQNRSSSPVWAYITAVEVQGVHLVNSEAALSDPQTLMFALRDEMPDTLTASNDWLPETTPQHPVRDIRYFAFNRAHKGMIAAPTGQTPAFSPPLKLYGKTLGNWPAGSTAISITPTFTISADEPAL